MSTESEFLKVVDKIQAAALDEALWGPTLDSIADLVGGAVATSTSRGTTRPVGSAPMVSRSPSATPSAARSSTWDRTGS